MQKNEKAMLLRGLIGMADQKKRDLAESVKLTPAEFSELLHGVFSCDNVTFKTLVDLINLDERLKNQITKLVLKAE